MWARVMSISSVAPEISAVATMSRMASAAAPPCSPSSIAVSASVRAIRVTRGS